MIMARVPSSIALAAVLVLAAGIGPGHGQILPESSGCLPVPVKVFPTPPVRIISKADPTLSMAADGKGGVVLAKTNCKDLRQLWGQDFSVVFEHQDPFAPETSVPFALVNFGNFFTGKLEAMQTQGVGRNPVTLVPYNPSLSVPESMVWTRDLKTFGADSLGIGYHKIRSVQDGSLILDGIPNGGVRNGGVRDGTPIWAFNEFHDDDNVLWRIEGFQSNP